MQFLRSKLLLALMLSVVTTELVFAAEYSIPRLTHVYTKSDGTLLIKWAGSPRPGPCGPGENYGWVTIESTADDALKSFVFTLYVSGKPARVSTSGCDGPREIVVGIYSPGG